MRESGGGSGPVPESDGTGPARATERRAGSGPAPESGGTGPARIAVVTGAGTGIGKAVALALVEDGYSVVFAGRRADLLDAPVTGPGAAAPARPAVPTDVPEPQSAR